MEPEQKSNGALIGLIIIVIILIIGGIYFWKNNVKEEVLPEGSDTSSNVSDTSGSIDSTADLDASVDSIDLDSLDSEI